MPSNIVEMLEQLESKVHISRKLKGVLNLLADKYDYSIDFKIFESPGPIDPLHPVRILKLSFQLNKLTFSDNEPYVIQIPLESDPAKAEDVFNRAADTISDSLLYNPVVKHFNDSFSLSLDINPSIQSAFNTIRVFDNVQDPNIIKYISDEIESRGDFEIDIPKFVDVLFKLGVIKAKEEK